MRKIREILRLQAAGLSSRQIAASVVVARSTVAECLRRAAAAGVCWPLPADIDEAALEQRLYPPVPAVETRPVCDWVAVQRELRGRGVTLALLREEYKSRHPTATSTAASAIRIGPGSAGSMSSCGRSTAPASGCSSTTPAIPCRCSIARPASCGAQIFVAVLGASSFTYAEATWSQALPDWLASHSRALAFFGGYTQIVVPDNLKSAVSRPHGYEPEHACAGHAAAKT